MKTTVRQRTASSGAILLMSVMATLAVLVSPSPASAQGLTVSDGLIAIGAVTVAQTAPCDMNSTETHWTCDDFMVSGGDPSVPNISVLAHVDSFVHDLEFIILLVRVILPDGCLVTMHGPYLLEYQSGDDYHFVGEVGAYLLSNCGFFTTVLVLSFLGSSPSTTAVLVSFIVE